MPLVGRQPLRSESQVTTHTSYDSLDKLADGQNPVPVGGFSTPCLRGFIHPGWCRIWSIRSIAIRIACHDKVANCLVFRWLHHGDPMSKAILRWFIEGPDGFQGTLWLMTQDHARASNISWKAVYAEAKCYG